MSFGWGVAAALTSPLVMTIGFCAWDNHWKGSAFALNLYKCTLASTAFLLIVVCIAAITTSDDDANRSEHSHPDVASPQQRRIVVFPADRFTSRSVGYLFLSSAVGIVIGDVLWLRALQLLGARRVIFVDSLKPFTAALLGWLVLDERIRWVALLGIVGTVAGILLVSLEQQKNDSAESPKSGNEEDTTSGAKENLPVERVTAFVDMEEEQFNIESTSVAVEPSSLQSPESQQQQSTTKKSTNSSNLWLGYSMSFVNVVLDTYGAVLTKEHGGEFSVWEINLLRFGFASVVLVLVSLGMTGVNAALLPKRSKHTQAPTTSSSPVTMDNTKPIARDEGIIRVVVCGEETHRDENNDATRTTDPILAFPSEPTMAVSTSPWYRLPPRTAMPRSSWMYVTMGVALVTVMATSLSNYALFEIALALTLTLTSVGPLYALPLTYFWTTPMASWSSAPSSTRANPTEPNTAVQRQPVTLRAVFGAVLTLTGVVVLAFWGTLPNDTDTDE